MSLYTSLYQTEDQIDQVETELELKYAGTNAMLNHVNSLPAEDPLLTKARARVQQDEVDVQADTKLLGPDNPKLVADQVALSVDRAALQGQMRSVMAGMSSIQINSSAQLSGLRAREAAIESQILQSSRRLKNTRWSVGDFARLQQEVVFTADVLKVALEEATRLRMENVSASSRMQVIDSGIPAYKGSPTTGVCIAASIVLAFLGICIAYARQYAVEARRYVPRPLER